MIKQAWFVLIQLTFSLAFAQTEEMLMFNSSTAQSSVLLLKSNINQRVDATTPSQFFNWNDPSYQEICNNNLSKFSIMKAAYKYFNTDNFPASAVVKIINIQGDSCRDRCSGVMVGDRFVLTAGHCVFKDTDGWIEIKEFIKDLAVMPAFDRGTASRFGMLKVTKTYVFKSYFQGKSKKDLALLELESPIGKSTGWVGVGFENDKQTLLNTHFINFSYPMDASQMNYPRSFNGDTLYFKSGLPEIVNAEYIGINGIGIPGESGSLLVADNIRNGTTAYGVRNFSEEKFSFYRLKEEDVAILNTLIFQYDTVKQAKTDDLSNTFTCSLTITPNPVFERAVILTNVPISQLQLAMYDFNGKEVLHVCLQGSDGRFLLENLNIPSGTYYLIAKDDAHQIGCTKISVGKQ